MKEWLNGRMKEEMKGRMKEEMKGRVSFQNLKMSETEVRE
jgi:hypothetical protein